MSTPQPGASVMYRLFSRQAAAHADKTAVRDDRTALTYRELSQRVDVLSAALRERCPQPGARIGLFLGRTVDLLTAVLAVTAAGHAYVPLDPAYPAERVSFMAADSGLSLVLSDRAVPEEFAVEDPLRLDQVDWSHRVPPQPGADTDPDAVAYVIYTSGSTGRPKGVEIRRRGVVAMVDAMCRRYDFTDRDVWTLFHSASFDFSVWEMWGALTVGATLVVVPAETALSPRAAAELLVRERVTVLNVVPSVFRYLTAAARESAEPPVTVRRIVFGGEAVDVADIRSWRRSVSADCAFVNTYGLTEATVFVSTRELSAEELDATTDDREFATDLGTPLNGWDYHVLDEHGRPVESGGTGEIWVSGEGLAVGYANRPELTAERFRLLDIDGGAAVRCYRSGDLAVRAAGGAFCYAGRADDQVKLNGFRIEPGEIEAVLRQVPEVRDLAVVRVRSRIGGDILAAYYASDTGCDLPELADRAKALLPRHMVPSRFLRLEALPLTPSGKTDRRALAETS
ncbi:hypothetical protein GCM10010300_49250 [Streptomyces olivaceoviridis]|uniref:amino acid adenylation domain-containing protein n=1 Tax=Streptomyces olivaceoviridis TaxID=1921 RepID=UPI001678C7BA|nr:amino acid adenylation domain-containing protein [Streptomyces olivaceoviridis]GGY99472.1 hypothetical protein GCM10010300_49250 [Streptomyces olivaceoviridis]